MAKGIIGRKVGMTQVFTEEGERIPVTAIQAGPCTVLRKKSEQGKDGYAALVLGFEEIRSAEVDGETEYKSNKPTLGFFEKNNLTPQKQIREIRVFETDLDEFEVGQDLGADIFNAGEYVDVTGKSKGRGFTGVMKRHNMAGFKGSHGTHEYFRHGGSIGMATTPGRVFKGKKMAGQHGNTSVSVQNLEIVDVLSDENVLLVRGSVPGPNGGLVVVRDAVKRRRRRAGA